MELSAHTATISPRMQPNHKATSGFSRVNHGLLQTAQQPLAQAAFGAKFDFKKIATAGEKALKGLEHIWKVAKAAVGMLRNKDTRQLGLGLLLTYALPALLTVGAIGTAFTSLLLVPVSVYFGNRKLNGLDEDIKLFNALNPEKGQPLPDRNFLTKNHRDALKRFGVNELKDVQKIQEIVKLSGAHHVRDLITNTMEAIGSTPDKIKAALQNFNSNIEKLFGEQAVKANKTLYNIFHLGPENGTKFKRLQALLDTQAKYMKHWSSFITKSGNWMMKSKFLKPVGIVALFLGNIVFALTHGKALWKALFGKVT